ncbi:MAG: putative selenium-dependent hydroxylase accessory protein YqeC [Dehalococcoidales bacterium]|nr:putative selenium-dependent hydroxylase accessory protein YqeC [Dehalococcoidales bacterium]
MNLIEAFDIRNDEVISIVGGGGKTTLMFALARELVARGHKVITTTTTRIGSGEPDKFNASLLLEEDERILLSTLPENLFNYAHLTVVRQISPEKDKLLGYPPEVIDRIAKIGLADIIVEADGARGKPIKAPNATEPVIPSSTTLVIPVVGMDALGTRLTEENAFRPEIISKLTGLKPGEPITEDTIVTLITHPQGITKGSPKTARIIPLLNKADKSKTPAAESIARKILEKGNPRIQKVVLGQVQSKDPIIKVISK